MVGFEALGIGEAQDLLGEVNHELKDGLKDRLKEAGGIVRDVERGQVKSGRIKSALTVAVSVRSLAEFEARIFPRGKWAYIARFIEGGTKPHPIPNFRGREGVVFDHPGARAYPFVEPTLQQTEDRIVELVGIPPVLK